MKFSYRFSFLSRWLCSVWGWLYALLRFSFHIYFLRRRNSNGISLQAVSGYRKKKEGRKAKEVNAKTVTNGVECPAFLCFISWYPSCSKVFDVWNLFQVYYPVRHQLMGNIMIAMQKFSGQNNTPFDQKRLSVDLAEVVLRWELMRLWGKGWLITSIP